MNQLRFLDCAQVDLAEIADFYEKQEQGAGDYFLDQILHEVSTSLLPFAGIHRQRMGFHQFISRRFPVGVFYTRSEDAIVSIYAILDLRRRPFTIHEALKRRNPDA